MKKYNLELICKKIPKTVEMESIKYSPENVKHTCPNCGKTKNKNSFKRISCHSGLDEHFDVCNRCVRA